MSEPSTSVRMSDTSALWLLGLAFTVVHVLAGARYGFHRDELLTYSNARDLEWGYVVYPPVTAWLARVELAVFGTSLVGFRFLAAVACGMTTVLTGLMARAMGGGRRAMLVSAFAASIGGSTFFTGSFMSYMSFDLLWWVLTAWCVTRLLQSDDGRWWIGAGAGIGLGLMTKYTMAFFVFGIVGGMLLTSNRKYLRSLWFWCGVAVALLIFAPNLWWQYQHHFVGIDWMKSIHARDMRWGRTDYFFLNQIWKVANVVTLPIWLGGLWFLFKRPEGKPWRMIGWMFVLTLLALGAVRGREYYAAPLYPMLMAAGAVCGEIWLAAKPEGKQKKIRGAAWRALTIGGLAMASIILPVAPVNSTWWRIADSVSGQDFNMQIGWPELARTVADVAASLPAEQRARLGVLAGDEGEAGAVNLYGAAYGLPRAISGMNSNWLRGYGDPAPETVIAVGMDPEFLLPNFSSCRRAADLGKPHGVANQTIGGFTAVYVCGPPVKGWPEFWKGFQYYG
ncbi:MAG TPA: glycosyltransferase family 39 protein [Terracidiphilus sp.]|nr:glycosyltransferase family 39 protein [Terracidiphilus sp.]